jgi:S-adenosylmethionine:tRNA ribosyltransferase-isomerase
MRTDLLDYSLPPELIAQHPTAERDGSRLLRVHCNDCSHHSMREWAELVPEGSVVVLNDTRVRRARLMGTRPGGGSVELLLLRAVSSDAAGQVWEAFARPLRRLDAGMVLEFGALSARVGERVGERSVLLHLSTAHGSVETVIEQVGHVPLPPYMRRPDTQEDRVRYQTVFAKDLGSVAAPTASLHLTEGALRTLHSRGVEIATLTLDVGPGTFRPVSTDDLDEHDMHSERYRLPVATRDAVASARARGAPVVAVGTTVVRTLEAASDPERPGEVLAGEAETELLIQPGHAFRVVDALLTNFHMPRSTLLALVAAFAGLECMRAAYRTAVESRYRFLSYGDAMWIPERTR